MEESHPMTVASKDGGNFSSAFRSGTLARRVFTAVYRLSMGAFCNPHLTTDAVRSRDDT